MKTNKNKQKTTYQNFWDSTKAALIWKFKAVNAYIFFKRSKINNLTVHLKELKEKSKVNSKLGEENNKN